MPPRDRGGLNALLEIGRAVQLTTDRSGTSERWSHWNIRHWTESMASVDAASAAASAKIGRRFGRVESDYLGASCASRLYMVMISGLQSV